MKNKVFFNCTTLIGLVLLSIFAAWFHFVSLLGVVNILMAIWLLFMLEDEIHASERETNGKHRPQ